ncbi:MAG: antitoxin Xre/MbcA/ParS toxin-binding domain-containing protein [Bryobacteraceae bacterium]|nr:antitoxin Xre/MbcA/ParS toxin-binding domain-containing protein [Bryobacteraceae bacterium]
MPKEKSPAKEPQRPLAPNVFSGSERERVSPKREADPIVVLARKHYLTDREQEALRGIALGLTTKEIALRMNVSPSTAKALIRLILIKMGVSSRAEVVAGLLAEQPSAKRESSAGDYANKRPTSSDAALNSVINRAIEVIGDREEAMRWLGTPVRALDYVTPISLLGTEEGTTRVEDVLGQMEHGVW